MWHHKSGIPKMWHHKSGIPEMWRHISGVPEIRCNKWSSTFQDFLFCGSRFRDFLICGASFREFPICCWPILRNLHLLQDISGIPDLWLAILKKSLEKIVFLACFPLLWVVFWLILTPLQSIDIHILQKKKWSKTLIPARNKSSKIFHPHLWSSQPLLNENPTTDKLSRAINYVLIGLSRPADQ